MSKSMKVIRGGCTLHVPMFVGIFNGKHLEAPSF